MKKKLFMFVVLILSFYGCRPERQTIIEESTISVDTIKNYKNGNIIVLISQEYKLIDENNNSFDGGIIKTYSLVDRTGRILSSGDYFTRQVDSTYLGKTLITKDGNVVCK